MDLGKLQELGKRRKCLECGEVFLTDPDSVKDGLTAMQKFSDHTTVHNPDGAAWSTAHHRIQVSSETKKPCDCGKCKEKGLA